MPLVGLPLSSLFISPWAPLSRGGGFSVGFFLLILVTASRGGKKSILLIHPKVPFVTWSSNKFSYSFFLNLKKIKAILLVSSPKMQGLEQRTDGELCWAAGWPLNGRQSGPEGQDAGGVSAEAGAAGPACDVFRGRVRPTTSPWVP